MKRVAQMWAQAGRGASATTISARAGVLALATAAALSTSALAGPEGGDVVTGDVTITNPTTTTTQVDQTSDRAIINWQSFNVGEGEAAIFNQPGATSVTLNRIFDQNPSVIAGLLTANGRIILINANGMVFENGASVSTAGLIATTADISNDDFMVGNYRFQTAGAANASIVNRGMITAEEGGVVAFVAPHVQNSGVITAKLGRVGLGAGNTFVLDLYGDSLISFPVSAEIAEQLTGADGKPLTSLVEAGGKIEAGTVQLTARAARGLVDNVINVDGEIIASGVARTGEGVALTGTSNNEIQLGNGAYGRYGDAIVVDGGQNGVTIRGTLDASSATGQGGNVTVTGRNVALTGATVDASGATGGGHIKVGHTGDGDTRSIDADTVFVSHDSTLKADAIDQGDGGSVVFWSKDATAVNGAISAKGGAASGDGGFLEVSSKGQVGFWGTADASAANGQAGLLTLDPKNIIISTAGGASTQFSFNQSPTSTLTINPTSITGTLDTGTAVTLQANNDLTVSSNIIVDRNAGDGGTLTLQAGRSVFINAQIFTDDGNLFVIANEVLAAGVVNAQRDPGNAVLSMGVNGSINAGAGQVRLTLASGLGKTNRTSGDITLRSITADRIIVENLGPTNGDVVLAGGTLTGTNSGTAIVLAAQGGDFINNAGANALSTTNGRWVVYSTTPLANTSGGLAGTPFYNTPYNPANPTDFAADGNRFAYSIAPVLTVAADDQTRDYGDFNPDFTYSITGFIAGDDPNLAIEGEPFVSSNANEASNAGTHGINVDLQTLASDYNYTIVAQNGVLTVVPAQLFYQSFGDQREYGEANNALFGDIVGFKLNDQAGDVVAGDLVFSTSADETANAGQHEINGSGLTVINPNYQLTILQDPGNATALTVTPAQLTFVADFTVREYGDPNLLTGTVEGLKNGETLEEVTSGVLTWTSSADATSPLGFYEVVGGGVTLTTGNYVATIIQDPNNEFALQITPAQLFYVADAKSKTYGQLNPTFTGTIQGLKNGDLLEDVTDGTLVWLSQALDESGADIYGIFGDGLTVTSGNYFIDVEQAAGNFTAFTVNPAQLTYVADPQSRIFGFPDPAFTGQVVGLTNGDTLENATIGDLVFTPGASSSSPAGLYSILGGGLTVSTTNYVSTILQDPGDATALTIVAIPLETIQTQGESANGNESATDQEQNDMASRSNDLGIVGVAPVSSDMDDGRNDEMAAQLCALNAPQSADIPGCLAPGKGQ